MNVYNKFFLHYMFEEWMTNRIYFLYLCLLTFLKFMILELKINTRSAKAVNLTAADF